ncbi:MAG: 4-deoxy-4-formamido-L-arabinose-phosphoundecaprenol deformylase [Burkholderiaceae bacterium]
MLALKIDVDTLRGTLEGVPRLVDAMRRRDAGGTFLFSLGPDHTGWALKRALRPGFLSKVSRTSVVEHYGVRTLLYGVLLPGPDIGRRAADVMRATAAAGFECGIHAWDHVKWHDGVRGADAAWTQREWQAAFDRFVQVFGYRPLTTGAAGWQINEHAVRLQQRSGIRYASDGRGPHPYRLRIDGQPFGPPQYPTTLPTLDELIGLDGLHDGNVHERLLSLTARALDGNGGNGGNGGNDGGNDGGNGSGHADDAEPPPQVFTLHAELEGQKLLPVYERLLDGWRAQGWTLCSLGDVHAQWGERPMPAQPLRWGEVPGRSGELLVST